MLPLASLRKMAEQASDLTETARRRSERCRDYYDSDQYSAAELAILRRRKQPIVWENVIRRKVDALIGLEMQGRVDPRGLPRQPDDQEAADLVTKALVYVDDLTRFDTARSSVAENMAVEGYGGVEVVVKQTRGGIDPDIVRLRWEEIVYDPWSREKDFSDATFMGVVKWMGIEKAIAFCRPHAQGKSDDEIREMLESSLTMGGSTYDDRPNEGATWGDKAGRRVKLCYLYYHDGEQWCLGLFCGGGEISNGPSPYVDEEGQPANAIILQSCYVDRHDNARAGIVYDWLPLQDEINKRRSKILHQLNSRQTMGHHGAIIAPDGKDPIVWMKEQLAQPDGHVEYDQDPGSSVPGFQIIPQTDQVAGQFQLLQDSRQAIQMLGPNASLQGQLQGKHSGRAIMAQQQAGMAELAPFYDGIRDFTLRVYRAVWMRIRQFWTGPRWVRVTDETEGLRFVGVNIPAVNGFGQIEVQNRVAELDVDIIIDTAPDYATLQQEQFEMLVDLAGKLGPAGASVLTPDVIIEASQLRDKGKILEKMRQPDPAQQEMQQRMAALEQAMREAKLASEQAGAQQKAAAAGKLEAETARIASEIGQPGEQPSGPNALDVAKFEAETRDKAEQRQIDAARAGAEIEHRQAQTLATMAQARKTAVDTALAPASAMRRMMPRETGDA